MKGMCYGRGYEYAHDTAEGRSEQAHLPPNLEGRIYYEPTDHGFEALVRERLAWREVRHPATVSRQPPQAPAEMAPGEEPQLAPDDLPPQEDDGGAPPPAPRPRGRPRKP
jgi:putative ATPase